MYIIILTIADFKEDTSVVINICEQSMADNFYSNLLPDLWVEYAMSKVKITLEAFTKKWKSSASDA